MRGISVWFWTGLSCLFLSAFLIVTSEMQEAVSGHPELLGTIDRLANALFLKIRTPFINGIAVDLTALGSTSVLFIFVFAVTNLLIFQKEYFKILHLLSAALGSAILTLILKFYFERDRPNELIRLVEVNGYSYPSGHSLSSAAIYFTVAILLCQIHIQQKERIIVISFTSIFVFLIAMSRVYLGVHYMSDVIAGVLVGIGWASILGAIASYIKIRNVYDVSR